MKIILTETIIQHEEKTIRRVTNPKGLVTWWNQEGDVANNQEELEKEYQKLTSKQNISIH